MFLQSTFYTEFLAESNLILAQGNHGNQLSDLLAPLRNHLHKEKDVLSFSFARYSGAGAKLSFFCEWYYQTYKLIEDSRPLVEENKEYLRKRVKRDLAGVPNLYTLVDADIFDLYLPRQLSFLQLQNVIMLIDLIKKFPYLNKYLDDATLSKITAAEIINRSHLYSATTLSKMVEAQSHRSSFVMISLPILLGFVYSFNQPESHINPKGVKWVMVEDIAKEISFLHQTGSDYSLGLFISQSKLSDKERFDWLQKSEEERLSIFKNDPQSQSELEELRQKSCQRAKDKLESLVFPDKQKEMLKDLVDWSYNTKLVHDTPESEAAKDTKKFEIA